MTNPLINELVLLANKLASNGQARVRIAVTPEEHESIRRLCLDQFGVFYGTIKGVPLVVDEVPRPTLAEFAH